jgi:hypothetical protein
VAGLPELIVEGLPEDHARALLDSVLVGPVDAVAAPRAAPRRGAGAAAYRLSDAGCDGDGGFAERARRELLATGETARKRTAQPARTPPGQSGELLTAQEAQVARLARDGLSNPRRSAPGCSSARVPSSTTSVRSSPSSTSARAASSTAPCPANRISPGRTSYGRGVRAAPHRPPQCAPAAHEERHHRRA